jgi:hypothetical protein
VTPEFVAALLDKMDSSSVELMKLADAGFCGNGSTNVPVLFLPPSGPPEQDAHRALVTLLPDWVVAKVRCLLSRASRVLVSLS